MTKQQAVSSVISRLDLPTGEEVLIMRRRFSGAPGPHVALISGIRGDTPEGVVALHILLRRLEVMPDLRGTLDFYPCVNPLAAYEGSTRWPFFDVDLGRIFPGKPEGHLPDRLANTLVQELGPADMIFEMGGPRPPFHDLPHVRVQNGHDREIELASRSGLPFVWARGPGMVHASTFAAQFGCVLRFLGGSGGRIRPDSGRDLALGALRILASMGVCEAPTPAEAAPTEIVDDARVQVIRATQGGLFLPRVSPGDEVDANEATGVIVDALHARDIETPRAPRQGRILSIREQPVVYPGSTVCRIVLGGERAADQ
jgi:hypothetical protein